MPPPLFRLASGAEIPAVGFGTGTAWFNVGGNEASKPLNDSLIASIKSAIAVGYTHLDGAEIYGTERELGTAIKESGVPRDKLFVTSKVWPTIADPFEAAKASLARLQLDYVDLFLIHAPFFSVETHGIDLPEAWKAMEKVHEQGLAKAIGVSNFRITDLKTVLATAKVKPVVNQIEFNPYLQSPDLVKFCEENGILVEAYAPLCPITLNPGGPLDPVLSDISQKYGKTPGQVLLRWTNQKGVVALTTSSKPVRQAELLAVDDFSLTEEEVARISEEGKKVHFRKYWAKNFNDAKL